MLQLRFTEGENALLEQLEGSFGHMEITDVPLFDKMFSFRKLALLQAAALQFDVLAFTGLRDENEVYIHILQKC